MCVLYISAPGAVRVGYKSRCGRPSVQRSHIWSSTSCRSAPSCVEWSSPVCKHTKHMIVPVIPAWVRSAAPALSFNSNAFCNNFTKCVLVHLCARVRVCACTQSLDAAWLRLWKYLAQCAKLQMLCLLTALHISCNNKQIGSGSLRGWQNAAQSTCGFKLKVLLCVWCLLSERSERLTKHICVYGSVYCMDLPPVSFHHLFPVLVTLNKKLSLLHQDTFELTVVRLLTYVIVQKWVSGVKCVPCY